MLSEAKNTNSAVDAEGNVGIQFELTDELAVKLTDWANEPSLLKLKADWESSKNLYSQQIARIQKWNDLINVEGVYKPKEIKGRSKVQPKLIRRQAEWRYSALTEPFLSSNKLFKVDPVTAEDVAKARQNELVLNWQFRTKMNRVKLIDDLVRTTVDEGTCIIRVGWIRQTVPVKTKAPVWEHYPLETQDDADALQKGLDAHQQDPVGFEKSAPPELHQAVQYYHESGEATVARQNGEQEVETQHVLLNQPTVEVLYPQNVFIDPSCNGDLDKAMFVVVSFDTCKADLLKQGKRYKNLDKVNWSSNSPASEPFHKTDVPPDYAIQDVLRRKVVAYEYWGFYDVDGNGTLKPFVATWIGNVMIRMELNPYPDEKVPFVVIPYMPRKRELFGEPDAELLEDNQAVLGATMRGMIDLLGRSANGQQGIAKGMLDALNRRRYDNGQDYEFNPNITPANGVIEHKFPELPASALQMTQMTNQEAEALTGVKSFSGGISGQAYGDVATGIKTAMDAAAKREMAILRRMAKGMVEVGNKIIAMNSLFLSEQETVRVTNEEFVQIKREDLKGNFDLDVDINTAEVDNAKAQDLAFMLQTCGPNSGPDIILMILAEIADLKRMPALAQKLRNYQPPPPSPQQQQLMQAQLQAAQLQVQLLQSQIELNQSKSGLEGAKKDKANLDFMEQSTGTTHVRDMQKIESQAHANQDLEVTKALLKPHKEGEKAPNVEAAIGYSQLSKHMLSNQGA